MCNLLLLLFTLLYILINLEGCGRNGDKEFSRFIDLAQGSAYEVRCQLFIAHDLSFLSSDNFYLLLNKIDEISRMMIAFQKKLKAES